MVKTFRKQEGFTLIELMIVVAIIGILAAIAIPNFLTYQLKSRQSEAKTNLMAIKTSEVAWNGERGCFLTVARWPALAAPVAGTKNTPSAWFPGAVAIVPTPANAATGWCVGAAGGLGITTGNFAALGFQPTGNVMYNYATGTYAAAYTSCLGPVLTPAANIAHETGAVDGGPTAVGFRATAWSNLDGDATLSVWASADGTGAQDCTTGDF